MKKYDAERAFALLDKIGFTRMGGTPEELKAAEILKAECESFGLSAAIEPFDLEMATIEAEFEILEPFQKKYTVRGYQCCENTPAEGLVADFLYVQDGDPVDLVNAKGKIVLVNGFLRVPLYRTLMQAGVAAIVTMDGSLLDKPEESDLHQRKLRDALRAFGNVPAVMLRVADAMDIVANGAAKARIFVKNENVMLTSHNVIAEIKGTEHPEEIISFGAHFDSVEFSKGVFDNGAGSVINMEIARYFMENPPKRTVKFCWYGSEEIGLCGSHAFVRDHADELDRHILMINVDVGGPVLGSDVAMVMAGEDLVHFTDYLLKINGLSAKVKQSIYSSDSVPFANAGVPGINFCRFGTQGASFIHNRHDTMFFLSAEALGKTTEIVLAFAEAVINAVVFPIAKTIPDNIKADVDKYLYKKELAEAKKAE
ncbi:MAG: Zn-dependent exopeptidase M28 [Clostridia bacterium]|nr:Zn-dependent exopeptidase M28 [Clostridia bacterium]